MLDARRRLARESAFIPDTTVDELEALRPRERMIVTLYAEGLAVDDIAQVRDLPAHGHAREERTPPARRPFPDEAARLVFADEVRRLL